MVDRPPHAADGPARPHLRVLTAEDGAWVVELDRNATPLARPRDWQVAQLEDDLELGRWAGDHAWGWAVVVDGLPVGWALVEGLDDAEANVEIRIEEDQRGRGIGSEVLRQLADHHFAAADAVERLAGRTHEDNVAMQRAFAAAGYRMEARYRATFHMPGGELASEWGYALTRADWQAGRHRADDRGYDLHGATFVVEHLRAADPHLGLGVAYRFLQEGRRVLARYADGQATLEGELAGLLVGDALAYRYVHEHVDERTHALTTHTGGGRGRLQRRADGRLEIVNDWHGDDDRHGVTVLVEQRSGHGEDAAPETSGEPE